MSSGVQMRLGYYKKQPIIFTEKDITFIYEFIDSISGELKIVSTKEDYNKYLTMFNENEIDIIKRKCLLIVAGVLPYNIEYFLKKISEKGMKVIKDET
jgi:hypothetical protein